MTAPAPLTAAEFNTALKLPDEDFNAVLRRIHAEVSAPYHEAYRSAKERFTKPSEVNAINSMLQMATPDISLSSVEFKPNPQRMNYTGTHGDIPMEGNKSVARANGLGLSLPKDTCLGCSPDKPLVPGYSCDDLSDPAQVRTSQLNRAFTGIHELAHHLFFTKTIADEVGKPKIEDVNPFVLIALLGSPQVNERQADSFAATLFIRYLGDEGAAFVRQAAAGQRYNTNGTEAVHNTSLALAAVLERYEKDPGYFRRHSLTELMDQNAKAAWDMVPTGDLSEKFSNLSGFKTDYSAHPDTAYQAAQARLALRAQPGMTAEQQALYDQHFKPGDQLMMNMEQLTRNLAHLSSLSPLDPHAPLGSETAKIVAECKARPGSSTP